MADRPNEYLNNLPNCLKLDSKIRASVCRELRAHLRDTSQEPKRSGLTEEEAFKGATASFGSWQLIAQQMHHAHSQGSWQEAFLTALPHFW